MLTSEMQHQFWITKKTVQRKLGSKEDEHIISSDADLDAKIEVLKSIAATSMEFSKIIDQYQERIYILSHEESVFGRFLKEAGKRSKTSGHIITNTGKAVSLCGHQRMCVRVPLLRLQHEVDVFRYRAVTDTQNTITTMEKERTEYRAALEWMKSASSELDPDSGRGLEKFRTAQTHVRNSKQLFDSLSLDSIQKIDLLAAARCNMFSHALVSYMTEMRQFAQKTNSTFLAISKTLEEKPKYDFCVLKALTQHEGCHTNVNDYIAPSFDKDQSKELTQHEGSHTNVNDYIAPSFDKDQSLFLAEDFIDKNESIGTDKSKDSCITGLDCDLVKLSKNSENGMDLCNLNKNNYADVAYMFDESVDQILDRKDLLSSEQTPLSPIQFQTSNLTAMKKKYQGKESHLGSFQDARNERRMEMISLRTNPWIKLFADLDPLANLEAFDLKLNGCSKNIQQT